MSPGVRSWRCRIRVEVGPRGQSAAGAGRSPAVSSRWQLAPLVLGIRLGPRHVLHPHGHSFLGSWAAVVERGEEGVEPLGAAQPTPHPVEDRHRLLGIKQGPLVHGVRWLRGGQQLLALGKGLARRMRRSIAYFMAPLRIRGCASGTGPPLEPHSRRAVRTAAGANQVGLARNSAMVVPVAESAPQSAQGWDGYRDPHRAGSSRTPGGSHDRLQVRMEASTRASRTASCLLPSPIWLSGGMSPDDALATATSVAAEAWAIGRAASVRATRPTSSSSTKTFCPTSAHCGASTPRSSPEGYSPLVPDRSLQNEPGSPRLVVRRRRDTALDRGGDGGPAADGPPGIPPRNSAGETTELPPFKWAWHPPRP